MHASLKVSSQMKNMPIILSQPKVMLSVMQSLTYLCMHCMSLSIVCELKYVFTYIIMLSYYIQRK